MHAFVVEDNERLRRLLVEELRLMPGIDAAGAAESAEEALEHIDGDIGLVLVDLSLPGMDGISLVRQLVARQPGIACLVVTGESDDLYVHQAFRAGAKGFLNKEDIMDLEAAVLALAAGGTFVSRAQAPTLEG